jgi:hypothetical protein
LRVIFSYYGCEILVFLSLILLLTLFIVVKLTKLFKGPLKWKF